jgi:glycosyltransferase involved in cell wall biosynthesis
MNIILKIAILGINRHFPQEHRIRTEIKSLAKGYRVDGYGESGVEGLCHFYKVQQPNKHIYRLVKVMGGLFPRFRICAEKLYFRRLVGDIYSKGYCFLICHNIADGLLALDSSIPFVFHSHEYLPRQFDGSLLFRLTEVRYRKCALNIIFSRAALVIVEGDSVANMYASTFGISRDRFYVMPSMPAFTRQFEKNNKKTTTVQLIHHGMLVPERGLELLIDIAALLGSKYHLTLMGPGPEQYIDELKDKARKIGNVSIMPPVPYENIVEALHGNDLGLVVFGSPHFHHKYMTVPNKFWECLQARVPVLVSPDSAMAEIIKDNGCGIVSDTPTLKGYVATIRALTDDDIKGMRKKCEELAWSHSRDSWLETYSNTIRDAVSQTKYNNLI